MAHTLFRGVSLLIFACALAGCSSKNEDQPSGAGEAPSRVETVPASRPNVADAFDPLHRPFKEATVAMPPPGLKKPADETIAMYEQIVGVDGQGGLWDKIRFVNAAGKRISYRAVIKTDQGDVEIDLFAEAAPNHVRNFIALAKVGYYSGLAFDYIFDSQMGSQPWTFVVAGSPGGVFEVGSGSIGYSLLPEIGDKLTHEEGTVGAWHEEALESAACKFYINVSKAPWMDESYTIFGKVTRGLDIVRGISRSLPRDADGRVQQSGRPQQPVIMRSVTIEQREG